MKRVVIYAVLALILMAVQANVHSAFGVQTVCHFGIIAAVVSGAFSFPLISSAIAMSLLAMTCDLFVSSPLGLYAFVFMVVFSISRALLFRFRSERLIFVLMWICIMGIAFDALLAAAYSAYYRDTVFFSIFLSFFWKNALVTTILSPVIIRFAHWWDRILTPKRTLI